MIPRYLILGDSKIVTPFSFRVTLLFKVDLGGLNMINSVLEALSDRRFAQSQSKRIFNSSFMFLCSISGFLLLKSKLVSSAKWKTEQFVRAMLRSFIYSKNKSGPKIEP